ncbi:MAG: PHP domain-containing protein [Dehalococcoidales bacterium]
MHTEYSPDCNTPLSRIVDHCLEAAINCLAISDHNTTEGALKLKEEAPFMVIVAEEVMTPYGEIMGMFLEETIPAGLSVAETISRIRAQGGLVAIPHPFDRFRHSALNQRITRELAERGEIDIIEVFNSRTLLYRSSAQAESFAREYGLPGSAGSDAHTLQAIGNAFVEMPEFGGREDFLPALEAGRVYGHRTNPLVHIRSVVARFRSRL